MTLKTYFVRKAASCEIVGLFVASSPKLLAALVDECCDPTICEYAQAYSGGLFVMAETGATWPLASGQEESGLAQAVLSQQWLDDLSSAGALEWKPLAATARNMIRSLGKIPKTGSKKIAPKPEIVEDRRRTGR